MLSGKVPPWKMLVHSHEHGMNSKAKAEAKAKANDSVNPTLKGGVMHFRKSILGIVFLRVLRVLCARKTKEDQLLNTITVLLLL